MNNDKTSRPVTVTVVGGSGLIGVRHCQHVSECADTILVAIVDPHPAAAEVAQKHGVKWYKTLDELLNGPERPDAAIVCTPNHTHVSLSLQLLRANVHVLCEKPISNTIDTAMQLIEEAKISSAKLLIGHHRRFNPYIMEMKKVLELGSLGQIIAVNGLWTLAKPLEYFEGNNSWRKDKKRGGGVIAINLVHEIDLMLYFFGRIERVHAERTISTRNSDNDAVEEGAAMTIRFESGVVGTFIISDNVASPHSFEMGTGENPNIPRTGLDCYRIFGTKGTLSFPDMIFSSYNEIPTWNKAPQNTVLVVENALTPPLTNQLQHFADVCRNQVLPSCSGEDGLEALMVCEAVIQALNGPGRGDTVRIKDLIRT